MSRLLKERTHRTHVPGQRAAEPTAGPPTGQGPGAAAQATVATVEEAGHPTPRHRVLVAAVAAVLVATALIWGASSLGDGTTPPAAPADVELQYRPMTGGVPIGP